MLIEHQSQPDLATLAWRSPRLVTSPARQRNETVDWRTWLASLDWRAPA
jgi:hypothetical protein